MADRWAADMVEAMRKPGTGSGTDASGLMIAKVNTANPLTLRINDQLISKHVYANPAYLSAAETALEGQFVLRSGDEVVVLQQGVSFYIITKVVAV